MLGRNSNPLTLQDIVQAGLCIGCGLCRSVVGADRLAMVLTPEGRERPVPVESLSSGDNEIINAVCPGLRVEGSSQDELAPATPTDTIWGPASALAVGHAGDPEVRHRCSTGGILTAFGQYLLSSGRVDFILHVRARADFPMRTEQTLSFDAQAVLDAAGSRYGPAAPLIDFEAALSLQRPFAVIAKPCDINAIHNLSRIDDRVSRYLRYKLVFVCGGASDLTKSEEVLREFGIAEDELRLFRYRGYGNPGLTRVETADRSEALTYQDMWAEESKWMIQPRCKICPDAIGEAADIAASDFWPGGGPTGEDEGFNGILVRTAKGRELFDAAVADGAIVIDREVTFREFDVMQPHQVRKKRAVWARHRGMAAAGLPVPETINLRIDACARQNDLATNLREARGARLRAETGRLGEPLPRRRNPFSG
jgi:coenzyme F420 hydrogenase subunit beta